MPSDMSRVSPETFVCPKSNTGSRSDVARRHLETFLPSQLTAQSCIRMVDLHLKVNL